MFKGSYEVELDEDNSFVFPEEWRGQIPNDRTFYIVPSHAEDIFTLAPKELHEMEMQLLMALTKSKKEARKSIEEAFRGTHKVIADEDWRIAMPSDVAEAMKLEQVLTLIGTIKNVTLYRG